MFFDTPANAECVPVGGLTITTSQVDPFGASSGVADLSAESKYLDIYFPFSVNPNGFTIPRQHTLRFWMYMKTFNAGNYAHVAGYGVATNTLSLTRNGVAAGLAIVCNGVGNTLNSSGLPATNQWVLMEINRSVSASGTTNRIFYSGALNASNTSVVDYTAAGASQKLAEAIAVFLGDRERALLHEGQAAVDLAAAPAGWTWQLASRGLQVTAVDNGGLAPSIARDPNVEHVRAVGLSWRPKRPVDWLVCDIVEKPMRVAVLVADWVASGTARNAIFNLKLPMKKRRDEVLRCGEQIRDRLDAAGIDATLAFRQLYHDREEVTGCVLRKR